MERHRTIEPALVQLHAAFAKRPLDAKDAFSEWGGTFLAGDEFRRGVAGHTWDELDSAFLERQHDALPFLGPHCFGDYLPAYVAALARRDAALSALPTFLLTVLTRDDDPERFDARITGLSPTQLRAVATVLAAYENDVRGTPRQDDVTRALDSYWRALI